MAESQQRDGYISLNFPFEISFEVTPDVFSTENKGIFGLRDINAHDGQINCGFRDFEENWSIYCAMWNVDGETLVAPYTNKERGATVSGTSHRFISYDFKSKINP